MSATTDYNRSKSGEFLAPLAVILALKARTVQVGAPTKDYSLAVLRAPEAAAQRAALTIALDDDVRAVSEKASQANTGDLYDIQEAVMTKAVEANWDLLAEIG
jgi:hypothetical protein